MTEKKLSYDELVERNRRLANMLIRRNDEFEQTLRAEVKKAKAEAWEQGSLDRADRGLGIADNPYKEQS